MDKLQLLEAVNRFFMAVDNRDWEQVKTAMHPTILLDYTSMAGGEPATLTPEQITDSWKKLLPGFDATHHQLGNYIVETADEKANVLCYGTAAHYLKNDSGNHLWTVAGTYAIELSLLSGIWKIEALKFNLRYMDGNMDLPALAQQRLMA